MRNREVIEREMYKARESLEKNLADLRHAVVEKVDVKARARVALEKGKETAHDMYEGAQDLAHKGARRARRLAVRGKHGAIDIYDAGRDTVRERPVLVGSIAAGVLLAGILILVARRNDWI